MDVLGINHPVDDWISGHLHPAGDRLVFRIGRIRVVILQSAAPENLGVINNVTLIAVPLFVFMGVMLERSGLAEELLDTMGILFGRIRGGLAVSVVVVGALLGASTGIVGATVVTMGLLARAHHAETGLPERTGHRNRRGVREPSEKSSRRASSSF